MVRVVCLLVFFLIIFSTSPAFASSLVINEVLVHPGTGNREWVEFYNPDGVDVSQDYIDDDTNFTDDSGSSPKKALTEIQSSNPQYPYIELTSSMFNNDGDFVVLFDPNGTILDQYTYTKDPGKDVALGRFPDGKGNFSQLIVATKGDANASLRLSPTLSPTRTPTPTKIPTPTHTPTPIKSGPTPTKTPTQTHLTASNVGPTANMNFTHPSSQKISEVSPSLSLTQAVLATNSSEEAFLRPSTSIKPIQKSQRRTLVKATKSFNFFPLIFSIVGGICLILCGILAYIRIKNNMYEV